MELPDSISEHSHTAELSMKFFQRPLTKGKVSRAPLKHNNTRLYSGEFTFKIRPTATSGIVFIATNKRTDHIAVMIDNGRVVFTYDTGSGRVVLKSEKSIIDGRWHNIKVSRRGKSAHLIVDDDSFESDGGANQNEDLIETFPPFYVGGVPSDLAGFTRTLLPGLRSQFSGCIKDFKLNGKSLDNGKEFGTEQCSQFSEEGMFFGKNGGYAIVQKEYEVGQAFGIDVDIRPRMKEGIIFSVGVLEYMAAEFVNGSIKVTVDGGVGAETLFHYPSPENEFCDGQWLNLKVRKQLSRIDKRINVLGVEEEESVDFHCQRKGKHQSSEESQD